MDAQQTYTLEVLFQQLGLDTGGHKIDDFIDEHQLPDDVKLADASFWTEQQKRFLKEELRLDADWAPVVDELNTRLHRMPEIGNQA